MKRHFPSRGLKKDLCAKTCSSRRSKKVQNEKACTATNETNGTKRTEHYWLATNGTQGTKRKSCSLTRPERNEPNGKRFFDSYCMFEKHLMLQVFRVLLPITRSAGVKHFHKAPFHCLAPILVAVSVIREFSYKVAADF